MFKVYWTNPDTPSEAYSKDFKDLNLALKCCEDLRQSGRTFVTMISENPNHVGKLGVSGVVDGKLPNGLSYEWSKNQQDRPKFNTAHISTDNLEFDIDDLY